jgi:predicted permease
MHPPPGPARSLGTTALALGAVSIPLTLFLVGLPLGVAAVAIGGIAHRPGHVRAGTESRNAWAGLALGLIAVALGVFLIARPDS